MSSMNLKIYPLIIPVKTYIDIFNRHNAYLDMNPSISIDQYGNVIILVRSVNYRKFNDNKFTMYENYSNSIYTMLCGKIHKNKPLQLDDFILMPIEYDYMMNTYPTYWKGMEDIRFINTNTLLVTVPECNPSGNPCIFKASLTNNKIDRFICCEPSSIEKNWMPFLDNNGQEYVVYSLCPFKIKSVVDNKFIDTNMNNDFYNNDTSLLNNYHGSTNGIKFDDKSRLFLVHINKERTYNRWLLVDIELFCIKKISKEFVFFKHSYIEFPVSLCLFEETNECGETEEMNITNQRVFISLGINDDKAYIIETDMLEIKKLLN